MAIRHSTPVTWTPRGASDALDGSSSFPGAMAALTNLIPDPTTRNLWAARPAAMPASIMPQSNGTIPSGMLQIGDILYGMIPSSRNPGHDEPFAYDVQLNRWLTVDGVFSNNVPASLTTNGDWVPPILARVGQRIIVTHPGFPGGTLKFGWFDISGLLLAFLGNTNARLNASFFISGNFSTLGLQPGLLASGTNIPATIPFASRVRDTYPGALAGFKTTANLTERSTTVSIAELTGFRPGAALYGTGIAPGTTILTRSAFLGAGSIIMSAPATATVAGGEVIAIVSAPPAITTTATSTAATWTADPGSTAQYFAAGQALVNVANLAPGTTITAATAGTITLSAAAIGSATFEPAIAGDLVLLNVAATGATDQEQVFVSAGPPTAPLWGAGDCSVNALPSVPLGVAQFNGRAYFACGPNGIPFSDSLQPCVRTNATQALTPNNGFDVTAVGPLMLSSPITGGIVQAIIAFQGANCMQQIIGDPATANLSMNLLPVATGTDAPLSITPTILGLGFISPDGLRFVDFSGNVSAPVGDAGDGITVPFRNAIYPSRICAASSRTVLRVTVQNGAAEDLPFQEWWYHFALKVWSGPHSFPAALIERWRDRNVIVGVGIDAKLWISTTIPTRDDTYVENGQVLSCIAETVLLPDNTQMAMNAMVEASLTCAGVRQINYQVLDEIGNPLNYVGIDVPVAAGGLRQRGVDFTEPVIFKQMKVLVVAQADQKLRLGNFYWRYEILGYNVGDIPEDDAPGTFILDHSDLGGADVLA